jgi:tetratricopeptide (TPR) repeat protein
MGIGSPSKKGKKQAGKKTRSDSHAKSKKEDSPSVRSGNTAKSSSASDTQKLLKDSKARYNIGLVYLKTGDYLKAQENLEHSLYCYITLYGHDSKQYSNETLAKIAAVREKLGDCYVSNPSGDKALAVEYYEEARRMLRCLDREDASDEVMEMCERIEEKVKDPKLKGVSSRMGDVSDRSDRSGRIAPLPPVPKSYERKKNEHRGDSGAASRVGTSSVDGKKSREKRAGVAFAAGTAGAAAGAGAMAAASKSREDESSSDDSFSPTSIVRKGRKKIADFGNQLLEGVGDIFDGVDEVFHARDQLAKSLCEGAITEDCVEHFEIAITHLEKNNHRTALNHLSNLKNSPGMRDASFRHLMVDYMMRVAESAMKDEKIGVATDAYEESFALLRQEDDPGRTLGLATRGCIKGHKLLAREEEKDEDWEASIQHRNRVHQLLVMEKKVVPTCEQLMMVAWCYGQLGNYTQSVDTLSDAINRLLDVDGVKSVESMPKKHVAPLIRCCQMRAVCYSKLGKWQQAHDQYDAVLPFIAREEGLFSKSYNAALVQKGALLVTLGKYREAANTLEKYMSVNSDLNNRDIREVIEIDDDIHLLALDTFAAAHLKLGKIDRAIFCFEKKLEKLNTMPKTDEMKGQTMHNLGCLLAYKRNYADALPMLSKALDTRKFMYNGTNKFLFESTWGVAATSQAMGNSAVAMKEYGKLLQKINKVDDIPISAISIHNSAGKLYFDNNKYDLALKSFNDALKKVDSSGGDNSELRANILLNLANVQSARGDTDKAIKSYNEITNTTKLKGSYEYFTALYNKSLLLEKNGEAEEARLILKELTGRRSKAPDDIKGSAYLNLGQMIMSDGQVEARLENALQCYNKAVDLFSTKGEELNPLLVQAKKKIAMAYFEIGEYDTAIEELQDIRMLFMSSGKKESALADIWSCYSRVYQKMGDIPSAKNYAKLSLEAYKSELGDKHPTTLRQSSNLAVILLEEAEALPNAQNHEAKTIIDAAKFEMEDVLESFVGLEDLWTYRLDVAALKTNLGLIAVWQNKPKKAQKLLRQVKEIEIPSGHPLELRIARLESSVQSIAK